MHRLDTRDQPSSSLKSSWLYIQPDGKLIASELITGIIHTERNIGHDYLGKSLYTDIVPSEYKVHRQNVRNIL